MLRSAPDDPRESARPAGLVARDGNDLTSTASAAVPRPSARSAVAFAAVLAAGLAIRLGMALMFPNIAWPDEIFQAEEQAHRLVFGSGIVPWEYLVGIRSWVLPGMIAGGMEAGRLFGDGARVSHLAVMLFMAATSLAPVACGFLWGRRLGGLAGAIMVGGLNAIWVDLVYYAPHPMTEVIAGNCLIVALYLAEPGDPAAPSRRRLVALGCLCALTALFRIQLAPAVAIAAVWACGASLRERWLPLAAGALGVTLAGAALDAATLGYPLQSIWLNAWVNVALKVSNGFGVQPWFMFPGILVLLWGGAFALIAVASLIGARRLPLLMVSAVTIIATHSLLPHKEMRFIYPALPLITTLCGVGTYEICRALGRWPRTAASPGVTTAAAIAFWAITSLALGLTPYYRMLWLQGSGMVAAFERILALPEICGVAVLDYDYTHTPGQSLLPREVPLYAVRNDDVQAAARAFNVVVAPEDAAVSDPGFSRDRCYANGYRVRDWQALPRTCLWRRDGQCRPNPALRPSPIWPTEIKDWAGDPRQWHLRRR